ncbi:MAG: alpha/beta hydrolase [Anaerolineales bacterium]|nr:alpha/beta hydrolase [Anaerolineales bacterium]
MSRRIQQLAAASQIIETSRGPVEALITGVGPAVVVLHGALGGYDRARVYSFPEAGFKFICPSRPGYLRTPLTAGKTAEEQADLTAALLDSLGIEKAAVIACSAGGPPAIQFTLRHPHRCWGLVMGNAINAPLSGLHGLITPVAQAFFGWDWFTWLGVNRTVLFLLRPNLGRQTLGDPAKQAHIKAMLDSMHPTSVRKAGLLNDLSQFQGHDGYPLEEISIPTLVVHGTADIVVPYAQGQASAKRIPNADFLSIKGGTHLCFISHHDIVKEKLVEFLQQNAFAN